MKLQVRSCYSIAQNPPKISHLIHSKILKTTCEVQHVLIPWDLCTTSTSLISLTPCTGFLMFLRHAPASEPVNELMLFWYPRGSHPPFLQAFHLLREAFPGNPIAAVPPQFPRYFLFPFLTAIAFTAIWHTTHFAYLPGLLFAFFTKLHESRHFCLLSLRPYPQNHFLGWE